MQPKVYIDEAGNTGSNITNLQQPYFVLSSVCFTDEELEQIEKGGTTADFIDDLKVNFERMMRIQTDECISEFYETLNILFSVTKGFEKFQEEIKNSALLKYKCYPLMPSSAETFLQPVDSSNDSDPLDFIVEKLAKNGN